MTQMASFLAPALAPKFLVFYAFALSALAVQFRGRMKMKALKKANRSLYRAIKYVTLGGLLAAFVVWA
jgi:hypothetical protein